MSACHESCHCRRFIRELQGQTQGLEFPNGFPAIKSAWVKTNNGGQGPLYWTQAQSPRIGETRDEYRHRLVYDRTLRWGIKEATEISNNFCGYHNRLGEASGQDYVVLCWAEYPGADKVSGQAANLPPVGVLILNSN